MMSTDDMNTRMQPRGRRLREQTDKKIVQTVLQIATSQGIGAVSIEEVARRSGVAKTTIYRRYRNTQDMLHKLQTLHLSRPQDLADPTPSPENLTLLLERMMQRFNEDIGITAVGIILTSQNEYFHHIVRRVIVPEQDRLTAFIRRGMSAGTLRRHLDPRFLFTTIIGSMVATQALAGATDAGSWAKEMVALLWPTMVNGPSPQHVQRSV